jgi:hydroxymethylpyrimidine pyrophosphatase-like HAD family hydrolase
MKEPHLIILDLDDTLMTGFTSYDEETFDYLRYLKSLGHIIMIATGRPFRSSYFVYEALGLDTPLINYNGARVTNPKDPNFPITDLRIDRSDLLDIIEHIRPSIINVFCEIIDDIYVMNYNDEIHPFLHVDGGVLHTGELKDILPGNPNGALFFLNEDYIHIFENYINNEYKGKLLTRHWKSGGYHIVEIYNPLVDKKRLNHNCENCGKSCEQLTKWKFHCQFFRANFYCENCDLTYSVGVRFKRLYDQVEFRKIVSVIEPEPIIDTEESEE